MSKVKIILIDDIHLEGREVNEHIHFAQEINTLINNIKQTNHIPILVLAGDIGEGINGVHWASQFSCDIVYICGNHEYWNQDYNETNINIELFVNKTENNHIKFLNNKSIILHGIRFIGTTLWTSIGDYLPWYDKNHIIKYYPAMGDFRKTTVNEWYNNTTNINRLKNYLLKSGIEKEKILDLINKKNFNPLFEKEENNRATEFLINELSKKYDGKTIVVTHHLPNYDIWIKLKSMSQNVLDSDNINNELFFQEITKGGETDAKNLLMMGYYANDLKDFMYGEFAPNYWFHGHLHEPVNEIVGRTKIISSPVGYRTQSNKVKAKIINPYEEKEQLKTYLQNEIENFDWIGSINNNLRKLEESIIQFEVGVLMNILTSKDFKNILQLYKEKHIDNLEKLKIKTNEWLKLIIYYNNPTISDKELTTYFCKKELNIVNYHKDNLKYKFPELLAAEINEYSFLSEENFKMKNKNNMPYYHYKEWLTEIQEIQIQVNLYKKTLLSFIENI